MEMSQTFIVAFSSIIVDDFSSWKYNFHHNFLLAIQILTKLEHVLFSGLKRNNLLFALNCHKSFSKLQI